jgi:hypothetical protein
MAKKPPPAPMMRTGKLVGGRRYDEERGRVFYDVLLDPLPEPEPAKLVLTLRHQMILAIIRRHHPKRIPEGIGYADLTRLVEHEWPEQCRRKKVNFTAPKRDAVKRALGRVGIVLVTRITRA